MESMCELNDVNLEELYNINGGSTKAAAIGLIIAAAALDGGAYIANRAGYSKIANGLSTASGVSGLASGWFAMAPFL